MKTERLPKVSVVVPNYNHARFLPARLDSILQQSFWDFELILLDDCSTDDSRAVLQSYATDARVRIEFNAVNSGSTFKQWNKGVRLARGEFVWIAESDDYADKRLLERLVSALDADPRVAYAYARSWRISTNNQLDGFVDSYLKHLDPHRWTADYCADGVEECRKYLVICNIVPNASAALFRRDMYQKVGGADESFRLCGDWKLWAAMALTGKVVYTAEPLNYFRFHETSVRTETGREKTDVLEMFEVVRWLLNQVTPSEATAQKMRVILAKLWVPAVMSVHVSLDIKRAILKHALAVDRNPTGRVFRPAMETLRLKLERHLPFLR
jgi:glycosyltransferase involved in cell wall biosynthesis